MKLRLLQFSALAVLFFAASCSNDDDGGNDVNDVILNSDTQALNQRITYNNAGVLSMRPETRDDAASSLPLVLVAEVAPPTYNGWTLKATHVAINGTFAYVSYNVEGEPYAGAIDVFNIINPNAPQLLAQVILPNTDVNSVRLDNGTLYIAGARSIDAFPEEGTPAFSGAMPLSNGVLTTNLTRTTLSGNTGTSITSGASKYYAVSGDNGSVSQLNKTTHAVEAAIPLADLRAIGFHDNKVVVLSGTEGVKIYNSNGLGLLSSFATSQDTQDAKRTIDFLGTNSVLVSEGENGLGVYNLSTGLKTQTIPVPVNVPDVDASDITTNAVSVNGPNVFIANGGAGMYIYKNANQSLTYKGSIALAGNSSCNYLASYGDYIFAAMGNGGLKIVKMVSTTDSACTSFAAYTGSAWLNINSNQTQQYQGTNAFQGININSNAELNWCGALSVAQALNINSNGDLYIKGSLAQGSAGNPNLALTVNSNATLKIEGNVVIYGNLVLNSNSNVEFVGTGSSITIYGNVTKGNNVDITGTFADTFDKL